MDYHQLFLDLKAKFPELKIEENYPLAPETTLKIGGPADIFVHAKTPAEFESILKFISGQEILLTVLGNGSNVLISDSGLRGLVIKNTVSDIKITDTSPISVDFHHSYTQRKENEPEKYLDFTKLDYDESSKPQVLVEIASGTMLPFAINSLISQGVTGLQWFAYIPGTVGGATWYNIHGGSYHFGDYIDSVKVFNLKTGNTETLNKTDLSWQYEKSYFQQHPELIILSTTLRLFKGDATLAKQVNDAWIAQKVKVQPMNSAGSAFANPSLEACQKVWGEQKSTGWIIDHELNWKGKTCGGAQISEKHSNFIVNANHSTAADYHNLLLEIQAEVKKRFNLDLVPEVHLLGNF